MPDPCGTEVHLADNPPLQREFRVMGSRAFVVVHGGSLAMLDLAEARLRQLESWWSRFRDDSDITLANQAAGRPVVVHGDTLAVVARALDAWRQTNGRFDITTLPALLAHGYTHSTVTHSAAPAVAGSRIGTSALVITDYTSSTLTVPAMSAIDLGGIGKGFAADIVAEEMIEAGATGALVNIGGDLVVLGRPSDDTSWYVGIEDPRNPPDHVATLRLECGGLATSGTTIRKWTQADGTAAHHLIDPANAAPSTAGVVTATVLAADAATAEVFATAAMMLPGPQAMAMLDAVHLAGLAVDSSGQVFETSTLREFRA
jgi:thiamine biosynthesis lipoprotein